MRVKLLQLKEEEERQGKVLADLKIRRDQEEAFLADARSKRELEQIEADRQLRDIETRKLELEQVCRSSILLLSLIFTPCFDCV